MIRAWTPSRAVLIAGLVVGCGGLAPSASIPAPTTTDVDLPIAARWSAEPVDPVDPVPYRAAAAMAGLTIGDRTVWTRTVDEHWLPAEPIEPIDRIGIVAWHRELVGWTFGPVITTSPDGLAWTETVPGPPEHNSTVLATLLDRLLLFGEGARTPAAAWASMDAATWAPIDDAPLGIAATAELPRGGLVAVGAVRANALVATTPNGTNWSLAAAPADVAGGITLSGVATQGSSIVAIGDVAETNGAWLTRDGTTWARTLSLDDPSVFLATVTAVPGGYLIAGQRDHHAMVWLSADGASWTAVQLPSDDALPTQAAIARVVGHQVIVFGYTTKDAGNGGDLRVDYRVWSLDLPA
jgi:hypothetical protein